MRIIVAYLSILQNVSTVRAFPRSCGKNSNRALSSAKLRIWAVCIGGHEYYIGEWGLFNNFNQLTFRVCMLACPAAAAIYDAQDDSKEHNTHKCPTHSNYNSCCNRCIKIQEKREKKETTSRSSSSDTQ